MDIEIINLEVLRDKYSLKCPNSLVPRGVVIHNTANNASARNEVAYMKCNNSNVSYHFAVDDKEIIRALPLSRNAWHAGDGANGYANRNLLAIEICYSKSGGERFAKAEKKAACLTAKLCLENGWSI